MTYTNSAYSKVSKEPEPVKGDWPIVRLRMHPDHKKLVDHAAIESGLNRSEFMYRIVLRKAQEVLGLEAA